MRIFSSVVSGGQWNYACALCHEIEEFGVSTKRTNTEGITQLLRNMPLQVNHNTIQRKP